MKINKILSLILAFAMVLGTMSISVFAEEIPTATATQINENGLTYAVEFNADKQIADKNLWLLDVELKCNKDIKLYSGDDSTDGHLSVYVPNDTWRDLPVGFGGMFPPVVDKIDLPANTPFKVMKYYYEDIFGSTTTQAKYQDLFGQLKGLKCGVYLKPEFIKENPDVQIEFELKLYDNIAGSTKTITLVSCSNIPYVAEVWRNSGKERALYKVGSYLTLEEAFANTQEGDTIEIIDDIVIPEWQQVRDKAVTINGNGHTVTVESVTPNTTNNGGALIHNCVYPNNTVETLNISNIEFDLPAGVTIAYIEGGEINNVTVNGGKHGFCVNAGTLFNECTFNGQSKEALYFKDGDGAPGSVVDSCTFNLASSRVGALWSDEVFTNNTINYSGTNAVTGLTILSNSSATVSGNTFPEDTKVELCINGEEQGAFTLSENIIDGTVFTSGGEITNQFENVIIENNLLSDEAVEGLKAVDEDVVSVNPAAEFNGKKYFSIEDAIEAAKTVTNPEITILAGIYDAFTVPADLNNVTFVGETDANGNNLVTIRTMEEGITTHTGGIYVQPETATFKNLNFTAGTVVSAGLYGMASSLGETNSDTGMISNLANLTVENCNFTGSGEYQAIWTNVCNVTIKDTTITNYSKGLYSCAINTNHKIVVDNSEITDVIYAIHTEETTAGSKINVEDTTIDAVVIALGGAVAMDITESEIRNASISIWGSTVNVSESKLYDTTYSAHTDSSSITINSSFANNVDELIAIDDANENIVFATYYPTEKDLENGTNLTDADKTSEIVVAFVKDTADLTGRTYKIVLIGTEGNTINDFESAHFTFVNNKKNIGYTITPNTEANITAVDDISNPDRISFYRNADENNTNEIAKNEIVLGTVRFEGYGDVDFSIDKTDAKVNATTVYDNIVETFTPDSAKHKLYVNWVDGTTTDEYLPNINVKDLFVEQKRDLDVVISFNNDIANQTKAYTEMTVKVTGQNGESHEKYVGSENADNIVATDGKSVTIPFTVTAGYRYTVKITGAGYRTTEYTTVIPVLTPEELATDNGITLTFWNNVKDSFNETEIEAGSGRVFTKNFLAGEIVQDNKINKYDLAAVVSYFGEDNLEATRPEYNKYDLNRDGVIDSEDIAYVLVSFGE